MFVVKICSIMLSTLGLVVVLGIWVVWLVVLAVGELVLLLDTNPVELREEIED